MNQKNYSCHVCMIFKIYDSSTRVTFMVYLIIHNVNNKDLKNILRMTHSVLTISCEPEKNTKRKNKVSCSFNNLIQNTELGIKFNSQCDYAITRFMKEYNV